MKKTYILLPTIFLAGCTQLPPHSLQQEPQVSATERKEERVKPDNIDACISLVGITEAPEHNMLATGKNAATKVGGDNYNSENTFCKTYLETKEQAFLFFQKYPEYQNSKNEEELLMGEFKKLLQEPQSKDLNIYNALASAHERLQALPQQTK